MAVINCGRLTSAVIAGSTASTKLTSFAPMLPVKTCQRATTKIARAGLIAMFNPTQIIIEAFIDELRLMYERTYYNA